MQKAESEYVIRQNLATSLPTLMKEVFQTYEKNVVALTLELPISGPMQDSAGPPTKLIRSPPIILLWDKWDGHIFDYQLLTDYSQFSSKIFILNM